MCDYFKKKENWNYDNYSDCVNKCDYEYGKHKRCLDCDYYIQNQIEIAIDIELEKMEKGISECETDYENEMFRI